MNPTDKFPDDAWFSLLCQAITLPDAPQHLVQNALDLWRQHEPQGSPPVPRRWVAVLSFDSWAGAPAVAAMRALPSETRQMFFAADGVEIDLRIEPTAGSFALAGQLFGADARGRVELTAMGRPDEASPRRSVAVNASSEFRLGDVHRGTYLVTLHLGEHEIVLPPIEIGPPRGVGGP